MSPEAIANLERTLSAFLALVTKLEAIGEDPEFVYAIRSARYGGPTWVNELLEAQECLREAQSLAASAHSPDPEVPGAAISPRAGG